MDGVKISVITATFNSQSSIRTCIESLNNQTYKNYEHIVIDGGSKDGTIEVLDKYKKNISLLISEPDNGIYDALNKGVLNSTGEIVGFLHSDDFYADKEVLEFIAKIFEDPLIDGVYGNLEYIHKNDLNKKVRLWKPLIFKLAKLKYGWMPPHPTLYLRRNCYEKVGGFNLKYKISADYDFVLRLFVLNEFKFFYLNKLMIKMRTGGVSNRNFRSIIKKSIEDYDILKKNKVGGIITLCLKLTLKIKQFFE